MMRSSSPNNSQSQSNIRYRDEEEDDYDDDNVYYEDDNDDENNNDRYDDEYAPGSSNDPKNPPPEQAAPPRREFKYSTANLQEKGNCYKYCMICLLFLAMILFMVGLSMILKHFFFSDISDNAPQTPERPANSSFPEDKMVIDQVCSRGTFSSDNGERCQEACAPQYFACCDPFDEFDLYNITASEEEEEEGEGEETTQENLNATLAPFQINATDDKFANCSLDQEIRGCMSYAKCQALSKQIEPAPSTLPVLCSMHHLGIDPVSCQELCKPIKCCYSDGKDNCLADNFDICADYAPCQNLRESFVLETAPDDLDQACLWQKPECNEYCEKARCCGDPQSSCLQDNFLSCLTYSSCNGVTNVEIKVGKQFSVVPKPPPSLPSACEEKHQLLNGQHVGVDDFPTSDKSCSELCEQALCCWANNPTDNCFFEDPLGCLAWEQQCQVLFE